MVLTLRDVKLNKNGKERKPNGITIFYTNNHNPLKEKNKTNPSKTKILLSM